MSQTQDDNRLHPVAHASRSVSTSEANYAISDLETSAVVWAVTHFHYYLYGHNVSVVTDHAAVQAILAQILQEDMLDGASRSMTVGSNTLKLFITWVRIV